jgi:hypothetical protein
MVLRSSVRRWRRPAALISLAAAGARGRDGRSQSTLGVPADPRF